MNSPELQAKLRTAVGVADSISRLEGYDPSEFEQRQKDRLIRGEITTASFITIMHDHFRQVADAQAKAIPQSA